MKNLSTDCLIYLDIIMLVNLQLLRGVAAMLVASFHMKDLFPGAVAFQPAWSFGLGGVDMFFVISGFIMVYSTSIKPVSPGVFMLQRYFRVAPLYYAFTMVLFLIAYTYPSLLKSTVADPRQLTASLLFVPFEKSPGRIYPTYYLGWTLNYEMFFYTVFAVAMMASQRLRVQITSCVLFLLTVAIPALVADPLDNVPLYFYTQPIMLDFVLGMFIGALRKQISQVCQRFIILPSVVIMLGIFGFALLPIVLPESQSRFLPPTDTLFKFGLPATLIVLGAVGVEECGRKWNFPILRIIGDASYSIYLSHFLVIDAAIIAANSLNLSFYGRLVLVLPVLLSVIVVGTVVFHFVEAPIIKLVRRIVHVPGKLMSSGNS